jgi:hypothetical protein
LDKTTNTCTQKASNRVLRINFILDDFGSKALIESCKSVFRSTHFAIQSFSVEPPGPGEILFVSAITQAVKNSGKKNAVPGKQQATLGNSGHH